MTDTVPRHTADKAVDSMDHNDTMARYRYRARRIPTQVRLHGREWTMNLSRYCRSEGFAAAVKGHVTRAVGMRMVADACDQELRNDRDHDEA